MLKWVNVYKCLTNLFIYTSPSALNKADLTCIHSKYNIIKIKSRHYKIYKYISRRGLYKIISPRISSKAAISSTLPLSEEGSLLLAYLRPCICRSSISTIDLWIIISEALSLLVWWSPVASTSVHSPTPRTVRPWTISYYGMWFSLCSAKTNNWCFSEPSLDENLRASPFSC